MTTNPTPHITATEEMSNSFLQYSMSVITARALPDVRDGLKPVQRRIIYAMWKMGVTAQKPHRKSATVVGETIGKYHPHSNDAIYEALVRMGQPHSLQHPLINPQGNFGTVDDPPAAMRYTECRLTPAGASLLEGIGENTVNMIDTFDSARTEPEVLPGPFPALLVNGSQGIAVGMATNIPPHNLGETLNAVRQLLKHPDSTDQDIMKHIRGVDFPEGGLVVNQTETLEALRTGRGTIIQEAAVTVEPRQLTVTGLPYQVSRDRLLAKIAELARTKKVEGVSNVHDETSAKHGCRIIITAKRGTNTRVLLTNLMKYTPLKSRFGVNMVALVDGVPRQLGTVEMIRLWVDHQLEVTRRKTRHQLKQATQRLHIVEGLITAVDNIDEIIQIIRGSNGVGEARTKLKKRFGFTNPQTTAVVEMPLRKLGGLEQQKLRKEERTLTSTINRLQTILNNPTKLREVVGDSITQTRRAHQKPRSTTHLKQSVNDIAAGDQTPNLTLITDEGKLVEGAAPDIGELPNGVPHTLVWAEQHTEGPVLVFWDNGTVTRHETGKATPLPQGAKPVGSVKAETYQPGRRYYAVTAAGTVKISDLSECDIRNYTTNYTKLRTGDKVVAAGDFIDGDQFVIFTKNGFVHRFLTDQIRPTGRLSYGVKGISFVGKDTVTAAGVAKPDDQLLLTDKNHRTRVVTMKRLPKPGNRAEKGTHVKNLTICTPTRVGVPVRGGHYAAVTENGQIHRLVVPQPKARFSKTVPSTKESGKPVCVVPYLP